MSEFKSKFNPQIQGHRFKMLQLIHGLALEINTGMKISSRGSLLKHAKEIGWISENIRTKQIALQRLIHQAEQGFGYVSKGRIEQARRKPSAARAKRLVAKAAAEKVPA